jgi:hypothetical protein
MKERPSYRRVCKRPTREGGFQVHHPVTGQDLGVVEDF